MVSILGGFALLASAITTNKAILRFIDPSSFVALRMLAASVLLAGYSFFFSLWDKKTVFKKWLSHVWAVIKRDWFRLCMLSLATMTIPALCKAYALKHLPSGKAAAFGSLDPFVSAVLNYFLFAEQLDIFKICGIAVGMLGALVLVLSSTPVEQLIGSLWIFSYPEIAMLIAVVVGRYGWLRARGYLRRKRLRPTEFNAVLMFFAGVSALVLSLFDKNSWHIGNVDVPTFWVLFAYTVIIGNGVAYTLYATALSHHGAVFVSLTSLSVPMFVSLYGYLFLGEIPSWHFFVAILLFCGGIALFSRSKASYFHTPIQDVDAGNTPGT